jgi:hypothetical protein
MWRLVVRPQVEEDLVEASLWYDTKQIGLGDQFLAEYVAAIYRILENPWLFSIAVNGLRPCLIKRFSYIIHFVVEDDQIIVIAVMNAARDDIDWELNRMSIPEPKVEHHEGRGIRSCPIFPELRPILDEAYEIFGDKSEYVVAAPQYRAAANTAMGWKNANLLTELRIEN